MSTFQELIDSGIVIDEDLVEFMKKRKINSPAQAHALGRAHWIAIFADKEGFTRDFMGLIKSYGLTWEEAAKSPALAVAPLNPKVGTRTARMVGKLGAKNFAELFQRNPEEIQEALAVSGGYLGELDLAIEAAGLEW